jgi:hypothetical protein
VTEESRKPTEAETREYAEHLAGVLRDEHGVELKCPLCGANEWRAFGDVGVHVLVGRDPKTGEVEGIGGSVHTIGASCGKCGLLSLFDRDVIGG